MLSNLKKFWGTQNQLVLNNGATMQEIEKFKTAYKVNFPDDFLLYLININGFDECSEEDENGFYFLSLSHFESVAKKTPVGTIDDCYIFCDYLSGSWWYAICLNITSSTFGEVYLVDGFNEPRKVGKNFFSFMLDYINESEVIY